MNKNSINIKGYYISAVDTHNNTLWVSNNRDVTKCYINPSASLMKILSIYNENFESNYQEGDRIFIYFNDGIRRYLTISPNGVTKNKIKVSEPLDITFRGATVEGKVIIHNISKPEEGIIDLTEGSFIVGDNAKSFAMNAYAGGYDTKAMGCYSHVDGIGTQTFNKGEFAVGTYNKSTNGKTLFSVGIGEDDENRENAIEVTTNKDVYVNGINFKEFVDDIKSGHKHNPNDIICGLHGYKGVLTSNEDSSIQWTKSNDVKVGMAAVADESIKAKTLSTSRNIGVGDGVISNGMLFNGGNDITIPIKTIKESYIDWDNRSLNNRITPIDMAMSSTYNSNRFAFSNPNGILFEISFDNGETWEEYFVSDEDKIKLVSNIGASILQNDGVLFRVTFDGVAMGLHASLVKMLLNTTSKSNTMLTVQYSNTLTPSSYHEFLDEPMVLEGKGTHSISLKSLGTFGGSESGYGIIRNIRLTFNGQITLHDIQLFCDKVWKTPSMLSENGHVYSYDYNKNVTFPSNVLIDGGLYTKYINGIEINENCKFTDESTSKDGHYVPYDGEIMVPEGNILNGNSNTAFITGIKVDSKGHITEVKGAKMGSCARSVTTSDIEIKNGPLAEKFLSEYNDGILPAGTTLQKIMEILLK